jgi:hypothetical protein
VWQLTKDHQEDLWATPWVTLEEQLSPSFAQKNHPTVAKYTSEDCPMITGCFMGFTVPTVT